MKGKDMNKCQICKRIVETEEINYRGLKYNLCICCNAFLAYEEKRFSIESDKIIEEAHYMAGMYHNLKCEDFIINFLKRDDAICYCRNKKTLKKEGVITNIDFGGLLCALHMEK